jgi:hypothetical protein
MAMTSWRDVHRIERSFRRLAYWHEVIEVRRRPPQSTHAGRAARIALRNARQAGDE